MSLDFFSTESQANVGQTISLQGGELCYYPNFFPQQQADNLLNQFEQQLPWRQEQITLFGKRLLVPRLSAWYADDELPYTYSGITHQGLAWTQELMAIRRRLETAAAVEFNSVLANLYRDGSDSNGWHADDEVELGDAPVIASVSFGQPRVFQMKHRTDKQQKFKLELPHGSVLMMRGETQKNWLHQIAKSRRSMTARINLTFRWVDPLLAKSASRT